MATMDSTKAPIHELDAVSRNVFVTVKWTRCGQLVGPGATLLAQGHARVTCPACLSALANPRPRPAGGAPPKT